MGSYTVSRGHTASDDAVCARSRQRQTAAREKLGDGGVALPRVPRNSFLLGCYDNQQGLYKQRDSSYYNINSIIPLFLELGVHVPETLLDHVLLFSPVASAHKRHRNGHFRKVRLDIFHRHLHGLVDGSAETDLSTPKPSINQAHQY